MTTFAQSSCNQASFEKISWTSVAMCDVDFSSALWQPTNLVKCVMVNCTFRGHDLHGAQIIECSFNGGVFENIDFSKSVITHCQFLSCQLSAVNFFAAKMIGCIFSGAVVWNCNFKNAVLPSSNFDQARIGGVDFASTLLKQSRFEMAAIESTKFNDADLWQADFSNAVISEVDFSGADLSFASFHAVSGDVELSPIQEAGVSGTDEQRLNIEQRLASSS
ncbi:pentapeptide repeat-containing protein [Pseudomonadales bacterium]|nr:pentapeptide repeat-containing protein [Pseudomonadales bacterium]